MNTYCFKVVFKLCFLKGIEDIVPVLRSFYCFRGKRSVGRKVSLSRLMMDWLLITTDIFFFSYPADQKPCL